MALHITKDNWSRALEAALEAVLDSAGFYAPGSLEAETLVAEAAQLRRMREMVRDRAPEDREEIRSYLIAVSVHENLVFPDEITDQLGSVYNVYRLWRRELTWTR